jgi:hypothetical protein
MYSEKGQFLMSDISERIFDRLGPKKETEKAQAILGEAIIVTNTILEIQ